MPEQAVAVTKIFADGADFEGMLELAKDPRISGFTTNPTLMRKAGIGDYEGFARKVLDHITELPVSLEVFSDDFDDMKRQARAIARWGTNVYVKIPVTNTRGESSASLVRELSMEGLKLNVTALLSLRQVESTVEALSTSPAGILSVFAGRIADTGRDPVPLMCEALAILGSRNVPLELLWASPREILNLRQAQEIGCHIITISHELLRKLQGLGRDLEDVSLDTVKMFRDDAVASGYLV